MNTAVHGHVSGGDVTLAGRSPGLGPQFSRCWWALPPGAALLLNGRLSRGKAPLLSGGFFPC